MRIKVIKKIAEAFELDFAGVSRLTRWVDDVEFGDYTSEDEAIEDLVETLKEVKGTLNFIKTGVYS